MEEKKEVVEPVKSDLKETERVKDLAKEEEVKDMSAVKQPSDKPPKVSQFNMRDN